MELVTGQEVWIAFATGFSTVTGQANVQVGHGIVIDGENRVVKRDNGYVSVCRKDGVEQCHPTEAAAWEANARYMERQVADVAAKAAECRLKAAEAAARAAVEVAA